MKTKLIEVRKLVAEDAAAYWALRLEAVEREPRSFGVTPEEHRLTTIEETVALILKPGCFLVGAFDGEALVGIARFDREGAEKERHKGHVRRVYVTASHRGRGVAKSLLAAIIAELKDDSTFEQLLLSVGTFNHAARAAYLAMGFVPFGIEPRSLRVGNEYFDEENMVLRLR
jgi:GNAT superfamily N-acetyltransferase